MAVLERLVYLFVIVFAAQHMYVNCIHARLLCHTNNSVCIFNVDIFIFHIMVAIKKNSPGKYSTIVKCERGFVYDYCDVCGLKTKIDNGEKKITRIVALFSMENIKFRINLTRYIAETHKHRIVRIHQQKAFSQLSQQPLAHRCTQWNI